MRGQRALPDIRDPRDWQYHNTRYPTLRGAQLEHRRHGKQAYGNI